MESSGGLGQPPSAAPEGLLADLMGPLPDPLDMSGEELDQLLTEVDALVGLNPVLRQSCGRGPRLPPQVIQEQA
eukprot:11904789-Alexandrium_andersonii.AAC.1